VFADKWLLVVAVIQLLLVVWGAIATIQEEWAKRNRILVLGVFVLLGSVGLVSTLGEGRQAADGESKLELSLANLSKSTTEISRMTALNTELQNRLLAQGDTISSLATGGDSFCILMFDQGSLEWKSQAVPVLENKGLFPLYGVSATVTDNKKFKQLTENLKKGQGIILAAVLPAQTNYDLGDVPAHSSKYMWDKAVSLQGSKGMAWSILYVARNGSWNEELLITWNKGKWVQAVQVRWMVLGRKPGKTLFTWHDPDFPRNKQGNIDWEATF
jgi:hypothetical protein